MSDDLLKRAPKTGFVVALLFMSSVGAAASRSPPDAVADPTRALLRFDSYVREAMRTWGVPGVAVVLVKKGLAPVIKGYGVRNLNDSKPVDANTLFAIASVTKSFTAGTLAILVDEHKVEWDDPVRKYLPGLELYDPQLSATLTVRDLLAQRTCLEDKNLLTWNSPYGHDELVRRMRYLKPVCTFRDRFEYNNFNYLLAGDVAAAASGETWAHLVESRLFTPLGMTSSTTSAAAAQRMGNVATAYINVGGNLRPLPLFDEGPSAAAGAIHSTATDMARWLEVQLGEGTFRGATLWSKKSGGEMHREQIPAQEALLFSAIGAQFGSYGFGWYVHDFHGSRVIEHNGQSDGMHALVLFAPEERLGIVVLTNTSLIGLPHALALRWLEEGMGLPRQDWISRLHTTFRPINDAIDPAAIGRDVPHVLNTHPSLAPTEYAGTYHNQLLGDIVVTAGQSNGLNVMLLGRVGSAHHWHYDTFHIDWGNDLYFSLEEPLLTFQIDAAAKPHSVTISSGDQFDR